MTTRDPHYTTAFGAILDQEITDALRAGMRLELIYAEMAARTRAIADHLVANHLQRLVRESEEVTS